VSVPRQKAGEIWIGSNVVDYERTVRREHTSRYSALPEPGPEDASSLLAATISSSPSDVRRDRSPGRSRQRLADVFHQTLSNQRNLVFRRNRLTQAVESQSFGRGLNATSSPY
jgi:hypothetical protein